MSAPAVENEAIEEAGEDRGTDRQHRDDDAESHSRPAAAVPPVVAAARVGQGERAHRPPVDQFVRTDEAVQHAEKSSLIAG